MTTITLPRATVEQALEALQSISNCYVGDDDDAGECASCHERSYKPHALDCKKNNAITALKAALQQEHDAELSAALGWPGGISEPVAGPVDQPVRPLPDGWDTFTVWSCIRTAEDFEWFVRQLLAAERGAADAQLLRALGDLRRQTERIERLREALQAMVDCSHTMDVHCCARASQLAAAALKA